MKVTIFDEGMGEVHGKGQGTEEAKSP